MKRSLPEPRSIVGWKKGTLIVALLLLASAPMGGCSPSDDAGSSQAADDMESSDDENMHDEEDECYVPPRTETCDNGGGTRRCYSYPSFYPWWPPITGAGGMGTGGAGELTYCPPPEVLLETQQEGPCGHNLVEVCSEAEQEGEECCYETIHYTAGVCCG